MELIVIKTEEQYKNYLDWVDEQFEKKIDPDSPEGKKLEVALLHIKQSFPDPIEDE